ncbi:unnamed protein product [Heterobilharzia americana]|nr:unnamed protein product [Heterobilharzia americana]
MTNEDNELDIDSLADIIRESCHPKNLYFTLTDPPDTFIPEFAELTLVLDKRYFPVSAVIDERLLRGEWCNVAAGAAAYAYKSIGSGMSEPVRKWLANAACCAILFSLIGEVTKEKKSHRPSVVDHRPGTSGDDTDDDVDSDGVVHGHINSIESDNEDVESSTSEQSINEDTIPPIPDETDGNWIYGIWTKHNMASIDEMKSVLRPEMMNDCVKVMIASVICFFQEGCYIPHRRNNYAMQVIKSNLMNRHGIVDECDKLFVMSTTGGWISKVNILTLIMKQRQLSSELRSVNSLGLGTVYMNSRLMNSFNGLPSGWTHVYLVDCIADKLVRSKCIRYFDDYKALISHKKLWRKLTDKPIFYHTENHLLTGKKCDVGKIDSPCLYGRLITFLKYADADSELFAYPQLKVCGKTREEEYEDYCDRWNSIVKIIYLKDVSSDVSHSDELDDKLKQLGIVYECDEYLLRDCLRVYGVTDK